MRRSILDRGLSAIFADPVANMNNHLDISLGDRLVLQTVDRVQERLGRREWLAEIVAAVAFLAAAGAMLLVFGISHPPAVPIVIVLLGVYIAACLITFDVGTGWSDLTQLVLIPILFLLPAPLIPPVVVAGRVLARLVRCMRGDLHPSRILLAVGDSWHAMGPALVVGIAAVAAPRQDQLWIVGLAVAAQIVIDAIAITLRDWAALGIPPRVSASGGGWVVAFDVMLSCAGVLVAFAVADQPYLTLLLVPFFGVFVLFARDRRARINGAAELSAAYRGTAMLLGDMVEADHEYTGSHSRDVVDLSVAVADRLGLSKEQRRRTEFGALLHDIGKVAIPKSIIDKPGPLDDDEWQLMKTHTIAGQHMLDRIGGLLGDVGVVVRASHEDFDGRGYPDGLAADAIPIEARIITVCDAFSAMTTDRSYRKAMGLAAAVAELERCAGTQFDPTVVAAFRHLISPLLADDAIVDGGPLLELQGVV
jgi:HD-GYP domain-containing protein (c-di-GMP phosphodiesterase class II)